MNDDNPELLVSQVDNVTDDKDVLQLYIEEKLQRLGEKNELRTKNLIAPNNYPPDSYFGKLDSSLKKNTAFVKKLRMFSASQLDSLLKDMSGLNLSKYISEIATALCEAKLKMTDIPAAVQFCSTMHQTYAEFSSWFYEAWARILTYKAGEKVANPSKLRVDLRFYAELISVGIFINKIGLPLLGSALTSLINMDKEEHSNVSIILTFCKFCGEDYAGLVPKSIRELVDKHKLPVPRSELLPIEKQANVRGLLKDYYNTICRHLINDHAELQHFQNQNRKILQTKGELSHDRKDKLENLQSAFEKLFNATQNFSEILDEQMPKLEKKLDDGRDGLQISEETGEEFNLANLDVWGDEDTKKFYTELVNLSEYLPNFNVKKVEPIATITEEQLDSDVLDIENEEKVEDNEEEEDPDPIVPIMVGSNKLLLEAFLNNLPNCVNREMIDSASVEFIMNLNTKNNRKKLIRTLYGVNRTRLDLLPFYARFVATLYPVIPEVGTELCHLLKYNFKNHVREKDQISIESKVKVSRYIGELVKFQVYSTLEALYCLRVLLNDFNHHHIDMTCNLLEVCGRFLYCNRESHQRTKVYLEQMMRKKSVMTFASRYVTQIENAYYCVNPPDSVTMPKKERPVMQEFIMKLLYQDLNKNNTDEMLKLLRKLDWENEEVAGFATKCLTNAQNVKYFNVKYLANVVGALVSYQEAVGTQVVDGVLEDIRIGMEINSPKFNQRRVAMVKYLGELYNYRMIDSTDIFKVLYSLITFGISMDYNCESPLDPANNLFRIRLVCVLLNTCGGYFNSGATKKKLDYFLIFFQCYYVFKKSHLYWKECEKFPVEAEYLYMDCLKALRPNLTFYKNNEEAQNAVETLKKNFSAQLKLYGEQTQAEGELKPIQEHEEVEVEIFQDLTTTEDESGLAETDSEEMDKQKVNMEDANNVVPIAPAKTAQDDDEFTAELEKMLQENIQDRLKDAAKQSVRVDIPLPMNIKSNVPKKAYEQSRDNIFAPPEIIKEKNTTEFVLMLRKGNKQQYKSFEAATDSDLAKNLKTREEALKEEKMRVKRLTLDITERFEEEEYQETYNGQVKGQIVNFNRERKKYQHPKGAPDADLIFGPKKAR